MLESFRQLAERLLGYSFFEVIIELAVIWIAVYLIIRFLRGTRGAGVIKGLALLLILGTLVVRLLGEGGESFQRLYYLYDRALGFGAIAILVIFQPELRRALVRLGEARFFRSNDDDLTSTIDSLAEACDFLSKNSFGSLIAIERSVGLRGLVEGGTQLDARISARLLQSIFWPNSALHDLGVIIRGDRILAAGVQFPLAEAGELEHALGSRHRAAVGISQESDCLTVVVSEETGTISVAERGRLIRDLDREGLRRFLNERLLADPSGRKSPPDSSAEHQPLEEEAAFTDDTDEIGDPKPARRSSVRKKTEEMVPTNGSAEAVRDA